ncbi:EAL domain-containing protein [Micavibrio aeruginosavorus]|uniref:Cyclic nucleotide-binding domain protein n=1 Tax=Micavibrio aeruginosavorus (strain ARL-13) TaxID=856793 RepID=G2KM87_MICAA|nr:EAL domain-containing protein [Micavibrio aeruginosavorus]AEP10181.1 cyclic nucleotide-binding domain protein [Micavibrio aeruginosavorus ARL-13]
MTKSDSNGASHSKRSFDTGEIIMRQGDAGDCAYIIEEGTVEILIEKPDGRVQHVGTRGPGALIGEMAIVDSAPRTATVRALKPCKMLEITMEDFTSRLTGTDPVMQMIMQVILTRYRDTLTRADILHDSDSFPPPEMLEQDLAEKADVVESIKIANEFQTALENGELSLHYQPIIDLTRGNVVGFEALMRWIHPEKGFISPGVFIPIAEKNGLIVQASRWALGESCRALRRIEARVGADREMYMSVNFSSTDFASENFIDHLYNIISESDVLPTQVRLEITERLLIQQPDNAKAMLQMCKDAGMGIAIDDFGTGYSSLSYLYYFPIDTLKVDQSFVRAMQRDEKSLELVKSIVGLGKNMKMSIIAEGVETVEEARLLQDMGCDKVQGYYFAKPMPEKDVIEFLRNYQPIKLRA